MATTADLIGLGMPPALADRLGNSSTSILQLRLANNVGLQATNAAGSGTQSLIKLDTGNFTVIEFDGAAGCAVNTGGNTIWSWDQNGNLNGDGTSGGDIKINRVGKGLQVKEGSNARMGANALTAGAATVANTSVTATSRIFLTSNTDGGTPGFVRVSARSASTSFTITSSSGTDTSTIAWFIMEPL